MSINTLVIPIGFILLAAMLCWMLIGANGRWWWKLAAIVVVPAFGLAVWQALPSYKGWPTSEGLPNKAQLLSALVREPDPATGDPGAVYLWAAPVADRKEGRAGNPFEYPVPDDEPRAYVMPYSRRLHADVVQAQQTLQQGRPMMLERRGGGQEGTEEALQGEGAEGDQSRGTADPMSAPETEMTPIGPQGRGSRSGGDGDRRGGEQGVRFYELPPGRMQPKD